MCILPFHICTTRSNTSLTSLKRRRRGGAQARADTACNDRPTGSGILHESRSGIRLQSSQDLSHGSQLESTSRHHRVARRFLSGSIPPLRVCAFRTGACVEEWTACSIASPTLPFRSNAPASPLGSLAGAPESMEQAIANQIRGQQPEEVTELVLDTCKANKVTGLEKFVNLRTLTLNGCGLTTLEGFPQLPQLRQLELSDNNLSDGLESLQDACLVNLKSLSLAGNKFSTLESLEPLVRALYAARPCAHFVAHLPPSLPAELDSWLARPGPLQLRGHPERRLSLGRVPAPPRAQIPGRFRHVRTRVAVPPHAAMCWGWP